MQRIKYSSNLLVQIYCCILLDAYKMKYDKISLSGGIMIIVKSVNNWIVQFERSDIFLQLFFKYFYILFF